MNRLIIVGNGFDKAHGLPTGYDDFIKWYKTDVVKSILTLKTYKNPHIYFPWKSYYMDELLKIESCENRHDFQSEFDLELGSKYGNISMKSPILLIDHIMHILIEYKKDMDLILETDYKEDLLKKNSEAKTKEIIEFQRNKEEKIFKRIKNAFHEERLFAFKTDKYYESDKKFHNLYDEIRNLGREWAEGRDYIMEEIFEYLIYDYRLKNNLKSKESFLICESYFQWNESNIRYYPIKFEPSPLLKKIFFGIETPLWSGIESDYYDLLCGFLKEENKDKDENKDGEENRNEEKNRDKQTELRNLNAQLNFLKEKLIEYLKEVENNNENNEKISSIENAISDPIKSEEIYLSDLSGIDIKKGEIEPKDTMVLNFNYTHTVKIRYNSSNRFKEIYIHGEIDNLDSIIFGYGDEMDTNFIKLKEHKDKECRSNIKSVLYTLSDNYRKLLSFIESDTFQVLIMGHSCEMCDRTLLNTIFEHKNCVSIKPYYYKKEDGTDNFTELVQNISRNFNDMKLYRARVVGKPLCSPLIP